MNINYDAAPNDFGGAWQRYIEHGILPGSFGTALLENDLCGSFSRADHTNIKLIREHVQWLYDNMPSAAWGSPKAVSDWINRGGMSGE